MRIKVNRVSNVVVPVERPLWYFHANMFSRVDNPQTLDIWFKNGKPIMLVEFVNYLSVTVRYIYKYSIWYDRVCSLYDLENITWRGIAYRHTLAALPRRRNRSQVGIINEDFTAPERITFNTYIYESNFDKVAVFDKDRIDKDNFIFKYLCE